MEVAIITNVITTYREGFYDRLLNKEGVKVTVYCQDNIPGVNVKSIHKKYGEKVHLVKCMSLKNEKLAFQFLPVGKIKKADVIFLDGNPRIFSNILLGIILSFTGKKMVIWTMAHSFGANKYTEWLRLKWTSLFKNIFVYTDKEVNMLRAKGFSKQNILGMNNGLDQKKIDAGIQNWPPEKLDQWKKDRGLDNKTLVLSIARLVSKNKFEQMIEALPEIAAKVPDICWCLVGSGEEEGHLKSLAKKLDVEKYIYFAGQIYEEDKLAPFFLNTKLFIHPASVGLSIIHAFGYGLPIVVNPNEAMHGPEYGAFVNDETGKNFKEDDASDLAKKVIELLDSPENLNEMSRNVKKIARESYNVDVMVERFLKMAKSSLH
ncbi:glycosyltransferase involved in cell wall biosynthesis [Chryseobacterium defluvii]|uniref:Glycosyltransferase involved in cell wall biosynthesis n=1 Tax=Chryseobacterium defluvii TaxID=160396 RepID=A0A840KDY6_9FLAO|nr:glycosyltransferase [Chryseobacterium defluvii]MBB4806187.1 glycosyltransferase involved in cell wall biosynthesis [Chryseobacterium defluvii]